MVTTPFLSPATVIDQTDAGTGLVVSVRPPRESIDKCKDKRYKRKNKQVQKKLARLEMDANESDWEYEGEAKCRTATLRVNCTVQHSIKRNVRQRLGRTGCLYG